MKLYPTRYIALFSFLWIAACSETSVVTQPVVYPDQQLPPPVTTTKPPRETIASVSPVVTGAPIGTRLSNVQLYPSDFNLLPGWENDDHAAALKAFRQSCKRWNSVSGGHSLSGSFHLGTMSDWHRVCSQHVGYGQERQFFEQWFIPYAVSENGNFDGMFTGYYLPELHGSYHQSARYNIPIYRKPSSNSLRTQSRAAIKSGALANKGLEIVWVDNEIDAFFMEIQGSGRVIMEDGTVKGLGFASGNGHKYYAIGKTLVDNGEITREDISMQTIRAWLEQHPVEGRQLMLSNPSYVFFRETPVDPNLGPKGAMGVPLTAEHSLAVDRKHLPLGIPIWLDAQHPTNYGQRLRRLVVAQDTGGAIKGVIRGDVYWGQGDRAGQLAGPMKSKGFYYLLIPRHL